jgi:thiamine pyrophosphokinase
MRYLMLGLLISSHLVAADWLCTEEASQRKGNSIYACGIGEGSDEGAARLTAFDAAKIEFSKICSASDDCKMHRIAVSPERTACEKSFGRFKCYRLIVFAIGEEVELKDGAKTVPTTLKDDKPDSFEAFDPNINASSPKVRIGMTKAQVLQAFGKPWTVDGDLIMFKGPMCSDTAIGNTCAVRIENGRVNNIVGFDFKYTDALN